MTGGQYKILYHIQQFSLKLWFTGCFKKEMSNHTKL